MNNWISVKERMPEVKTDVLAIDSVGDYFLAAVDQSDGKTWRDEWFAVIEFPITHWMPLPEPPEEE